ncbi:MAG TPA: metallophosphoesterase family protein [Candidatus Hydrogenedentes bacterium]|nr:metallophosphoesterase family protein [Candidatus Hydrogenedentota bacterium]
MAISAKSQDVLWTRRGFLKMVAASAGLMAVSRGWAADTAIQQDAAGRVPFSRVTLSPGANPAREVGLAWRCSQKLDAAVVQFAPALNNDSRETANAVAVTGSLESVECEGGAVWHGRVYLNGLEPGKTYRYRVGDGTVWGPWYSLRTADGENAPFSFIYLGDIQNDIRDSCTYALQTAWRMVPDARFAVCAGDLVENGYDDLLWQELHDAMGYTPSWMPVLATPGNHDTRRREGEPGRGENTAHPLFNRHFAHPENGPEGIPELRNEVYYVDYQGARLISLNANHLEETRPDPLSARCIDAQLSWLDRTLADAGKAWKIVFFHQPVYSTAKGRDNKALRERLRPLFEKHGVHLVLQGHDHCYGRTHKCAGDRIVRPDEPGVVYVTAVLGPKLYDLAPKYAQLMARQYDKTRTVQAIRVTPDTLEYRSLGLDGALLDQFSLVRSADGTATELREM